jgi:hypothetical protein
MGQGKRGHTRERHRPGIPEEIQHRIFDPFFTTRQDGTGLGLSIVQRIAEGFGGTVSMETSSEGTVFSVFIPLADEDSRAPFFSIWRRSRMNIWIVTMRSTWRTG